jgi:hypothetical protein
MRPRLAGLLQHRDRERLAALCFLELTQAERRGHSRRPSAHDQDIEVQRLAVSHDRYNDIDPCCAGASAIWRSDYSAIARACTWRSPDVDASIARSLDASAVEIAR